MPCCGSWGIVRRVVLGEKSGSGAAQLDTEKFCRAGERRAFLGQSGLLLWSTTIALLLMASYAARRNKPADLQRGASIYERCVACHAFEYDHTGPRHCGLFGRRAGT